MTQTQIKEQIRQLIVDEILWEEGHAEIKDDTRLLAGLLDSFGITQLIELIEERYEIVIDNSQLVDENLRTVAALAAFVESRMSSKAHP